MTKENIKDLLAKPTVDITDKFLSVSTISDGYTGTYDGDHIYKVEKSGEDYVVAEVIWDYDAKAFKQAHDPIITTVDKTVFFVVNTTNAPYENAGIREVTIEDNEVIEKQVLQAFLAFVSDEFQLGIYNVFVSSEAVVDDGKPVVPEVKAIGEALVGEYEIQ